MKDADGDTSPAKLTITITGANDNASVVTAQASGPDNTVFEAGLNPNGSNAGSTSETSTGSFTVSATDGILNIVIGGTSYTLAQMQAFNGTQTVNTGEGVLTLTGYSGSATSGSVSYSYTVSATIDNDSKAGATATQFDDSVVLTVNGAGGSTASDNLVVRVMDDVPTAANDGPSGVTEDGTSVVSGNVLTNDASGADVAKVFDGWSATGHDNAAAITELSKYGSLVQNGDGTWSYTLNNADADTQALTAASSLSYDLWYTMKDADGDTSPAKLTITITGANDNASVVTAQASGPDNTVFEAGLNPNGSNAGSTSETSTGSFTVSATDGILNIVIGGTSYTLAQMQAFNGTQTVNTGEGVLTLTGYSGSATSGSVSYSYTVSATIDNDSKAGATATEFDDSVVLTVNGAGGSTASDNLVVRIMDDLPQVTTTGSLSGLIVDETNLLLNDTDSFAGAFSFNYGADGAAATGAKSYALGVNTSSPTGLIDTATGQAVVLSLNGSGVVEGRTAGSNLLVFTLSVDSATGGAVLDQLRAIQHESGASVDTLNSANLITLTATITDGDGDLASAVVNIGQSISFYDDGPAVTDINGVIKNLAGQSLAGLIDYDLGADGTGSVTLSYTGPALTSHGKSVVFSLTDANSDGIQELVGKADLDGNGSLETTVLTLAIAGDATPEDGAYTLTLNDVIDLPVTRTTLLFDDISAGGGKDQLLVGTQLLIEDTNIGDGNAQVKASSGFVGIDNNIMNTGETVVYKFADTVDGSASPNYTITQKAIVNDVALKLFDTGSGSDTFTWTAYKNGVQVGTGSMTVGDHQNFDFTNNLSGITETGSDTTSDGLIHVDGGYDQLNVSVTSGSLKVGGVSYISVSNPEDLNLSFGYTATDGDGDAVSGSITTTVSATTATALSTAPADINTLLHPDNNVQP
jgi:VCBS repeat-containing protein